MDSRKRVEEMIKNYPDNLALMENLEEESRSFVPVTESDVLDMLNRVNQILSKNTIDKIAKDVIRGDWGIGEERKKRLTEAGYDYNKVQKRVNELI